MNIHQIIQLVFSTISAVFVVIMVLCKLITWIKIKAIDHKKIKEELIAQKEKELWIALNKKYGGSVK